MQKYSNPMHRVPWESIVGQWRVFSIMSIWFLFFYLLFIMCFMWRTLRYMLKLYVLFELCPRFFNMGWRIMRRQLSNWILSITKHFIGNIHMYSMPITMLIVHLQQYCWICSMPIMQFRVFILQWIMLEKLSRRIL